MAKPVLLVRAKFTASSGLGHVYRCLSLVERALRENWLVFVITDSKLIFIPFDNENLKWLCLVNTVDSETEDAQLCSKLLAEQQVESPQLVLVDHYELAEEWENQYSEKSSVAAIDDLCRQHHKESWVIDYFPSRTSEDYSESGSKLLLGLRYFLLRLNFINPVKKVENLEGDILVQFGGVSSEEFALPVLKALHTSSGIAGRITWLQGDESLLDFWTRTDLSVRVISTCSNMANLYANHKVALSAAGVAMYERLVIGLPALTWCVVDNQSDNFSWHQRNFPKNSFSEVSRDSDAWLTRLKEILAEDRNQNFEIDSLGANRVWTKICPEQFLLLKNLSFKPYCQELIPELYRLQCLPGVRKYSRNEAPPTLEQHQNWSKQLINSTGSCGWMVASSTGLNIGWLKLSEPDSDGFHEVSFLVAPDFQAMGIGGAILEFAKKQVKRLSAYVDSRNAASQKSFRSSGFYPKDDWFYWEQSV